MARGKQSLENLQIGFERLRLAVHNVEVAKKEMAKVGKLISERIALEQEELKPIIDGLPGWEVLYREEQMVLRSATVEVHIFWPDTLANSSYRIGGFLPGDKTCVTLLELPVERSFEEFKDWIATKLLDEVALF